MQSRQFTVRIGVQFCFYNQSKWVVCHVVVGLNGLLLNVDCHVGTFCLDFIFLMTREPTVQNNSRYFNSPGPITLKYLDQLNVDC